MFGAEYDKEEMMRKMAESAKMYDPSAMMGMTAAPGGIDNIKATIETTQAPGGDLMGLTPGAGVDNVAATIADIGSSPDLNPAMIEASKGAAGGMSLDIDKLASSMAATPMMQFDAPPLPQAKPMGYTPMQGNRTQSLGGAADNMGLMELIKRAQQMGRM
tara:strand:- start:5442 stop:5921 length:480 start_codon:yes stop_codon:yes gene_type:complete